MAPRNSPSTEVPASTPKSVGCNACSYDGIAYWAIGGKRSIDYPAQGNPHYVCWLCVSITMRPGVMWARECVYLGYDIIPSRLQRGKINCETNDGHCDCCDWGTLQNLVFELPRKGVAGHGCYAVQKILKLRILQRQDIGSTIYRPLIPWMNNCPRRVQHVLPMPLKTQFYDCRSSIYSSPFCGDKPLPRIWVHKMELLLLLLQSVL